MAEQQCTHCGRANGERELYCFACGHILPAGERALRTRSLPDEDAELAPQLRWGTAFFDRDTLLRLQVRDTHQIIEPALKEQCVLGRTVDDIVADVDLSAYRGEELGVSRTHVRLRRAGTTILVEDLGSRNGTFLNGTRLIPYQPRVLRTGDELRLGRLVLTVEFLPAG